ncbi:MAG: hypothetical protein ACK4SX_13890 [Alcanivoracaceae bacterium]
MISDRTLGIIVFALVWLGLTLGEPLPESDLPRQQAEIAPLMQRITPRSEEDNLRRWLDDNSLPGEGLGRPRRGAMVSHPEGWPLSDYEVRRHVESLAAERHALTYTWSQPRGQRMAVSALGTDGRHFFAPGYLVGWQPFDTSHRWVPWYAVSQRIRYLRDHHRYLGRNDVWQTGPESWSLRTGDCEDHALLLADWLINMGEDAWVVLGEYDGEGHAWVVLKRNDQAWLLEATRKFGRRALREYPLASTLPGYQPGMKFNRDALWVNEGSSHTRRYDGPEWRLAARFQP